MVLEEKILLRLEYLAKMLGKYGHRWNDTKGYPSTRMYGWIDEYNNLKVKYPVLWRIFCRRNGSAVEHDAHDFFA